MISDFFLVLVTKHVRKQLKFYKDLLQLELLFDNKDTIGVGKNGRLFIVLREDDTEESHHLTTQKGPQIITFKCEGNIEHYRRAVTQAGFKVRDELILPEHKIQYLFIEDYDGNEICLNFSPNQYNLL